MRALAFSLGHIYYTCMSVRAIAIIAENAQQTRVNGWGWCSFKCFQSCFEIESNAINPSCT